MSVSLAGKLTGVRKTRPGMGILVEIKRIRPYQAKLLAGFIYRKILTYPNILPTFQTEQTIADLWVRPANELIEIWGDRDTIDLHSAWQGKFHDSD